MQSAYMQLKPRLDKAGRAEEQARRRRDEARDTYEAARTAHQEHLSSLRRMNDTIAERVDRVFVDALVARRANDEERFGLCLIIAKAIKAMKFRLKALRQRVFNKLERLRRSWLRAKEAYAATLAALREVRVEAEACLVKAFNLPERRVKIVWEPNRVSLYAHGIDKPDGPGHAHFVLSRITGHLVWAREVFQERGRSVA